MAKDKPSDAEKGKLSQLNLGTDYWLSKRTDIYSLVSNQRSNVIQEKSNNNPNDAISLITGEEYEVTNPLQSEAAPTEKKAMDIVNSLIFDRTDSFDRSIAATTIEPKVHVGVNTIDIDPLDVLTVTQMTQIPPSFRRASNEPLEAEVYLAGSDADSTQ